MLTVKIEGQQWRETEFSCAALAGIGHLTNDQVISMVLDDNSDEAKDGSA